MDDQGNITLALAGPGPDDFTKFNIVVLPRFLFMYLTSVTTAGTTCYLAYDEEGVQLPDPCEPISAYDIESAKLNLRLAL